MKQMSLPFRLSRPLAQTDVHWVEARLLEQQIKLFQEALLRGRRTSEPRRGYQQPASGIARNARGGVVAQ